MHPSSPPASLPSPPPRFQVVGGANQTWADLTQNVARPILVHLNADTTWLLQLPYPPKTMAPPGRRRFNVLIDPWLQGPQSDVHSLFSTQWHVIAPSVATMDDLNNILRDMESTPIAPRETLVHDHRNLPRPRSPTPSQPRARADRSTCDSSVSMIDAVIVSHEFTDHCHQRTLLELPRSTPIFASDVAADLVRSWGYFDQVVTTPALGAGVPWSRLTVGPLPDWLAIGRVITPGNALYYHAASLVVFDLGQGAGAEAVIYSPHGIDSKALVDMESSGLSTLALLHGLDDVRIWMTKQLNLGALNGIKAANTCKARFWIPTHDEVKRGGGFIAPLLQRTSYSFKDAVKYEEELLMRSAGRQVSPLYQFIELGSGDGLVLPA
ncbi:hypothetical protein E4U42_003466 [Claviceps africana]|uniref:Uncharacterized protein n=1 Tax=Claviceps africana TaxID=83212 RepID=A0A8K0NLL4_9HYPO|nr:hypothetical protein E4U42_003466 [Claviceps africana]